VGAADWKNDCARLEAEWALPHLKKEMDALENVWLMGVQHQPFMLANKPSVADFFALYVQSARAAKDARTLTDNVLVGACSGILSVGTLIGMDLNDYPVIESRLTERMRSSHRLMRLEHHSMAAEYAFAPAGAGIF
jgi:hypothetical protein